MQSDSSPRSAEAIGSLQYSSGALIAPITQSTTFARTGLDDQNPFSYSRVSNPTVVHLETALAALEGADEAVAFASGMSATTALLLAYARPGHRIIVADQVYGGTTRLIDEILQPLGLRVDRVDGRDLNAFAAAIDSSTRLVFVESPTNPTLSLTDLRGLSQVCRQRNVALAVDNTFLTPIGQNCKALGVGIRLQSTTKYIDGHNATIGGVITTEDRPLAERLRRIRKTLGSNQKPFEAWLTLQGLQTLPLRFARQCETASALAAFLKDQPQCLSVCHPSLPSHPQFSLAREQQDLPGAIIAFELRGDVAVFLPALRHIPLAENLGATQTLITHPASMTHADLSAEQRQKLGITPTLLRLSVGIEDFDLLQADLVAALQAGGRHD